MAAGVDSRGTSARLRAQSLWGLELANRRLLYSSVVSQRGQGMNEQLQGSQPETEQGKYVYCIIKTETPRDFGTVGIGGRGDRVYSVHYREFAAVVSNCPLIVFDPTRENALAHEHVNELVMKDFTVLPMSFGTVFRTENDIKEFLKGRSEERRVGKELKVWMAAEH